jgi:pimeloyl-ACP methyl ester carboxylesterase
MVAPILSQHARVVAVDQRGHGESDKPDSGYDFASVAADLHGFIGALGVDKPVLVGHSWGGDVALEHAVAHPSVARGLCFVDGGTIEISAAPDMTLERARDDLAPPDLAGMTVEELEAMGRSMDLGFELTPEIKRIMLASFEVLEDNTVRARFARKNHMAVIDAFWDHRPSELYERVTCPVLLMPARRDGGHDRDWLFAKVKSTATASSLLRTSKTVWLEDSVHDVPLQRPQLVAAVIAQHLREGFF